jgi:small-conductance mechanosensitive channel/CRP-like cAMP-binding protein
MAHYPGHLIAGAAALVVALAVSSFTPNRLVRRKLRLSLFLLGLYVLGHIVAAFRPDLWPAADSQFYSFERLALAAALINLFVVTLLNPVREDRVPDSFPSIVQDAVVIGLLLLMATFALGTELIATSAVSAVVLGFALQDTLGNAIAGLAIQSEKPFKIGHWVKVGDFEGRVTEVTWRATKIRTKTGNFIIVPNSIVGKDPIINYSEPVAPTRIQVEVGVHYDTPPTKVKTVLIEALRQCPLVLDAPAPQIELANFAPSSIDYAVRFWIEDFARDEVARDQVRTAIYYAFRRHDIEIPYPIQTEISIEPAVRDERIRVAEREQMIGGVDLFASLAEDQRRTVAAGTIMRTFGDAEKIVREGDPGHSMYIVCDGYVDVVIAAQREPIARIGRGGYFGEMSLLTGDPRSASVIARGDVTVLEIDAEVFRQLGEVSPHAVEQVAIAAATRRTELDDVRASTQAAAVIEAPKNLIARMRRFLRLR